jgi:hypothetical protein
MSPPDNMLKRQRSLYSDQDTVRSTRGCNPGSGRRSFLFKSVQFQKIKDWKSKSTTTFQIVLTPHPFLQNGLKALQFNEIILKNVRNFLISLAPVSYLTEILESYMYML